MTNFWRIFVYSWKNLARNAWIALATIFVFMMALLSVNVLLGVNAMMERVIMLLENRIDVTVAFKPGTPDGVLSQARFFLTSLTQISEVKYISADDVLAQFKTKHANDPKILSGLEELSSNPLGAQIVIKARSADDYPFLLKTIENPQYAQFVLKQTYDDQRIAIENVRRVGRNMRIAGAALIAIFALFGLLIAFNAIRVAIYTQREEIAIMRLVGASTAFIRAPFILEGIWLAVFALGFSAALVFSAILWIEPIVRPLFDGLDSGLSTFFISQWPTILLIEGGGLAVLVILVSWAAVGRYIRR